MIALHSHIFWVNIRKISIDEAVAELYKFVSSNMQMYQKEMDTIFKL
jgi:hypothetical protein